MAGQVIINELLTFVQNKIDVLDELSIVQICATNFSDVEIEDGKQALYSACGDKVRNINRKGEDKKKRNIKDIIKLLKEVDPDVQPIFVARDLNKLPPVSFDHVDVTRLLKDMTCMKTELTDFKTRMGTELVELRNSLNQHNTRSTEANTMAVTPKPGNTKSPPLAPAPQVKSAHRSTSVTEPVETTFTPTYRDIARKDSRPPRAKVARILHTQTGENRVQEDSNVKLKSNVLTKEKSPEREDNFTLVKNMKHKRKINNLRGTLECTGKIRVVESECSIYVSRAMKSVSEADIRDHIKDRGELCSNVELLPQYKETSFNSFKVTIPASKIDTFLDTNFWPAGLVYRRYRERRNTAASNKTLNGR